MEGPINGGMLYHEVQESKLCAVHCVNTVLQGPFFSEFDLAALASDLDRREHQMMMLQPHPPLLLILLLEDQMLSCPKSPIMSPWMAILASSCLVPWPFPILSSAKVQTYLWCCQHNKPFVFCHRALLLNGQEIAHIEIPAGLN
ncbi:hypothetical protein OSB04_021291 [Centaurea solstitialis]|uniref:ubiquitinyl hydrolase 1 n=1 Tax=Centaurea solstitialis TaxID=347529 RepID=A0AA38T1L9_9ASTR|nr:hypothetical protein OSB04_021291 [Centaurea solstitialis]